MGEGYKHLSEKAVLADGSIDRAFNFSSIGRWFAIQWVKSSDNQNVLVSGSTWYRTVLYDLLRADEEVLDGGLLVDQLLELCHSQAQQGDMHRVCKDQCYNY